MARFFIQDGNTTHKWRLKGHAREEWWKWLASWSVALRTPSDLGYSDDGFILPPLNMKQITIAAPPPEGMLFSVEALGLNEQRKARRNTIDVRVQVCADLVNSSKEPWIIWCELNDESGALVAAIPDAVEVRGSDSIEEKERAVVGFGNGTIRVLVSKASITGWGLNWQHCHNVIFVGAGNSFEAWYQAIRRCWRFGQEKPVDCYMIVSDADGAVVNNLERKKRQAAEMMDELVKHMADLALGKTEENEMAYNPNQEMRLPEWI